MSEDDAFATDGHRPWRASEALGACAGLRAYRKELRLSGQDALTVTAATARVLSKVSAMAVRGAIARPRFKRAAGSPMVGRGVKLTGLRQIEIGRRVRIEDFAEIQGTSLGGIVLGDSVSIGAYAAIRPSSYYGRFLGVGLEVGDRSSIGPQCFVGCLGGVTIGADVILAPGVMIFAENHLFSSPFKTIKSQGVEGKPVVVEDDCWIGSGVLIVGGVRIQARSIVGAGAVVTHDVEAGTIVAGNPARLIRKRSS